LMRTLHFS